MFLTIVIIFLLFLNCIAWGQKICIKEIDGEKVYTNLCDTKAKAVLINKSSLKMNNNSLRNLPRELSIFSREELEKIVDEKAKIYGIDAKLIKEIIKEESNWNVNAISPKGAMGIMQLMPSTALLLGVKNPFDPKENIDGGIRYIKYLLEKFQGNINLALAAYNAGPNLVESLGRIPKIPETIQYVDNITKRYFGISSPYLESYSYRKRTNPIKAIYMSDGTVLYTNRY